MIEKWADLRRASREELQDEYNKLRTTVVIPGDEHMRRQEIRDELHHREIRRYTRATVWMTCAIMIFTALNVSR